MNRQLTRLLLVCAIVSCPAAGRGRSDPLEITVMGKVLVGQGNPYLLLTAVRDLRGLKVRIYDAKGKVVASRKVKRLPGGRRLRVDLPHVLGRRAYTAKVTVEGGGEPQTTTFEAVVARPLQIEISERDVNLGKGILGFRPSRPVSKVAIQVLAADGSAVSETQKDFEHPASGYIKVSFDVPDTGFKSVKLLAYDSFGFYNGVMITPFYVEIPHEEVKFPFDSARIPPSEEPKLDRTLQKVREALGRFKGRLGATLYIAGYTDTVGSRKYNLDLSERRARSIARYLRVHGLSLPICYQGFGEDVLAVPTPDETPEPRNRRTIHVLSDVPPPRSKVFPTDDWKCL